MTKKVRQSKGQSGAKRRSAKKPIEMGLRQLEAKANESGYPLVADFIGVAALAAHDESPRTASARIRFIPVMRELAVAPGAKRAGSPFMADYRGIPREFRR